MGLAMRLSSRRGPRKRGEQASGGCVHKAMLPSTGLKAVTKVATGIRGFDEITGGGLPESRTTLVMGGPGCGKTIFGLQTLVNGARQGHEAGLFVAFEESSKQIIANAATFGWDLPRLQKK